MATKKTTLKPIAAKAAPVTVPDVIAIALDHDEKKEFKAYRGTEAGLVKAACAASGFTPEILAHRALLIEASRLLSSAKSTNDENGGRGVAGSADARIRLAYNKLLKEGAKKITPAIVALVADPPSSYRTAKRWMDIHGIQPVKINAGDVVAAAKK